MALLSSTLNSLKMAKKGDDARRHWHYINKMWFRSEEGSSARNVHWYLCRSSVVHQCQCHHLFMLINLPVCMCICVCVWAPLPPTWEIKWCEVIGKRFHAVLWIRFKRISMGITSSVLRAHQFISGDGISEKHFRRPKRYGLFTHPGPDITVEHHWYLSTLFSSCVKWGFSF